MAMPDPKMDLLRYLQVARDAMLWKLEGLGEYDVRRPLVPTGTNLLGLVKHVAGVEAGYLGATFGRPFSEPPGWSSDEAEPNADMWATARESREQIAELYRRVWVHSDATVHALALDAVGRVPWWPADRSEVTLHHVLVRMVAETSRHAGHADIVRELIDGTAGERPGNDNLAPGDGAWWAAYRGRLQQAADQTRERRVLSAGRWALGSWVLGAGRPGRWPLAAARCPTWPLAAERWVLGAGRPGRWRRGAGCWPLAAGRALRC